MTPEEFLQQLNPHSRVFDLSIDYKYTEDQLVLFAKLYHESELKKMRVADVSGSYLLGRINDFVSNTELSKHKKIVNIWLLTNKSEDFPKLPPSICPCEITLANGSRFRAYMDTEYSQDWIEYGNTFAIRRNGRRNWKQEDVVKWEFI